MPRKKPAKFLSLCGLLTGLFYAHLAYGEIPIPKPKPEALLALNSPNNHPIQEEKTHQAPVESSHLVTVNVSKEFGQIKIALEGLEPKSNCSLFQSGNAWYLVIPTYYPVKISAFQEEDLKPLEKVRWVETSDTTTIAIHIPPTYTPKIDLQKPHFSLIFEEGDSPSSKPLLIRPVNLNDPLVLNFREADEEFTVYDEDTGKHFYGYTSAMYHDPLTAFTYPELKILPSIKGLAIEIYSDYVDIESNRGQIKIYGVSATPNESGETLPDPKPFFSLFDPFDLKEGVRQKQLLEKRLTATNRLEDYLQLTWTNLSLGYIPEASATLGNLAKFYPQITLHPVYVTFSGLLKLLSRHPEDYLHEKRSYFRDLEIDVINNLVDIAINPYESAGNMPHLLGVKSFLLSLPEQLREELICFILTHGIYNKNVSVLSNYLKEEFIPKDPVKLTYYQLAYATYLSLTNKPKKAMGYFQALSKSFDSPFVATLAEFELVSQKIKDNRIAPRTAIDILERLRFQWRGDSLEYYITQKLISVLWAEQAYPRALTIMRKLIRYFPKQCQNDRVFQKMQEGLMAYFTKDTPTNLLEMLSVYQEFGDIAPDTAQGDQVIFKAIEGMVQLNLYGEASRLLKNHLRKKIKTGVDSTERQAKILLRIAAIDLMDKQGESALKILKNAESWPEEFRSSAIELKADALITVKKFEEALAIIPKQNAYDLKRAQTYFKMGNWQEAANYFTQALEFYKDNKVKKAQILTNIAICFALNDQNDRLKEIKNTYWEFMKTTPQKDVFAFLTTIYASEKPKDLMANLAYVDNLTSLAQQILGQAKPLKN